MVVFANAGAPVGKTTTGNYAGLSQVAVPFKGPLGKMGREEGMSVVEYDPLLSLTKRTKKADVMAQGGHANPRRCRR